MKKKTLKLCSAVLSATTIMSMLTAMPTSAVDSTVVNNTDLTAMPVNTVDSTVVSNAESNTENTNSTYPEQENLSSTYVDENGNVFTYGTGDLTLEEEIPEDVTVIDSVNEYYSVKGKKVKVPSGGNGSVLPSSVDNSQSEYFPKIDSQGGIGACVAWAQSYYQFTYTMNKDRGVVTTDENTFSPKFTYNLANGGVDKGSVSQTVYNIMKSQGNVPISMVPYDDDYLSWSPTEEIWRESIRYRVKDYQYFDEVGTSDTQITSPDDEDLEVIKTALSNGDVLTYSTHIQNWQVTKIKTNSSAPENAKYAGQEVVTHKNGYDGGHRMTLVGYNDNIWTDINGNNTVDAGEMGAFKIANSWGDDYGNDGFMWIAYDALNEDTVVEGGPETKYSIFSSIARIDVEPYNKNADIYMVYTLNSAHRGYTSACITAEKDGTKYTYQAMYGGSSSQSFSYDGTTNSNDGTMVIALNNVIPDITSENFGDYTWSVEFADKKADDIPLTVKNAEIVDETANKTYKPENIYPFTLENESKTVTITNTLSNNVVIYYRGFYNPKLHYKTANGDWASADGITMPENTERRGYVNKYVIEMDEKSDVTLYFSDDKGNVDDNNGKYYTASKGLNYFVTENVADPLKVELTDNDSPIDINRLIDFTAIAEGGYGPYLYQFSFENLDTGEVKTSQYLKASYQNPSADTFNYGYSFKTVGNYKVTVNVKDFSDNILSTSLTMYIDDKPFEYTTFSANPNKEIMVGDTVELNASTNFENIIYVGRPKNKHDFTVKNESNQVVYAKSLYAQVYDLSRKTSSPTLSWIPTKAGNYTVTVSTTDGSNAYAEKIIEISVTDYNGTIIGDADNNKEINIKDALQIMKYNVGAIESSELWLRLSDGNKDDVVDIKDAIHILKYVVMSDNIAYVGEVNYRELPTEMPTETPTEAPTETPTEEPTDPPVEENVVTFSNSHSWGGTIYCYYWSDSNTNMTSWPGKAMTYSRTNSYGQAQYTFEVPDGASYIIFTNGSAQTVDIPYAGGEVKFYPTTTNSKGHYYVETWA